MEGIEGMIQDVSPKVMSGPRLPLKRFISVLAQAEKRAVLDPLPGRPTRPWSKTVAQHQR